MRAVRWVALPAGSVAGCVRRVAAARPRLGQHPLDPDLAGRWSACCTTASSRCWCWPSALAALRLVPGDRLAPWIVALVVLVPVTLLGIPELGRFGARADNPTLLDRHYWLGWSVMVTLVVGCVVVGARGDETTCERPRG